MSWVLAGGLVFGMAALASCSEDQSRRENAELRLDLSATKEAPATVASTASAEADAVPAEVLPGKGQRYRVVVETAYFFDKPEFATPNGRYLRRGDTFYGEGETNGFVKAGFRQPNGVASTGWLKVQGLGKLAGRPAANPARSSRPPQSTRAAASPEPSAYETGEAVANTREPTKAEGSSPQTAVVQVARSYFYNSADLATPRKAFCQRGDKVRLLEARGAAVYVTFTNWEKVTTTGWMRQDALR
ncbi:hypothetical protein [Hymenobacter antarcticus]|uniref:hypothetical protein n=1 Tax=Hymenobacter antarcticus TaxID=486270 RepID=UPI0031E51769